MRQTQVLLARKVPGTQLSISYVAPYTPGPSQKTNTKNKIETICPYLLSQARYLSLYTWVCIWKSLLLISLALILFYLRYVHPTQIVRISGFVHLLPHVWQVPQFDGDLEQNARAEYELGLQAWNLRQAEQGLELFLRSAFSFTEKPGGRCFFVSAICSSFLWNPKKTCCFNSSLKDVCI